MVYKLCSLYAIAPSDLRSVPIHMGHAVAQWLRHCSTKILIPDYVT
jgi:hypothetical protein